MNNYKIAWINLKKAIDSYRLQPFDMKNIKQVENTAIEFKKMIETKYSFGHSIVKNMKTAAINPTSSISIQLMLSILNETRFSMYQSKRQHARKGLFEVAEECERQLSLNRNERDCERLNGFGIIPFKTNCSKKNLVKLANWATKELSNET